MLGGHTGDGSQGVVKEIFHYRPPPLESLHFEYVLQLLSLTHMAVPLSSLLEPVSLLRSPLERTPPPVEFTTRNGIVCKFYILAPPLTLFLKLR